VEERPSSLSVLTGLRIGLTLIITFMVVSSPIVIFLNPVLISAKSNNIDTSSQHSGFSVEDTSTPPMSPTNVSPLDSDFTTQAALSSLSARPTNNIVNTNSFYDVVFLTATAGAIKTIQVTFPAGTTIPSGAFFNEAEGIGPGTASKSGQTITYTVTNAVNVPAGTKIRLEFANINNPLNPSASYQVSVTTRNAANAIIDGPSQSTAYTIKQIGVNAIADNSVTTDKIADGSITSAKPAESFMKRVTLLDNAAGNAVGWNPDGATTFFTISDTDVSGFHNAFISVTVSFGFDTNYSCDVVDQGNPSDTFQIQCSSAPANFEALHYVVINLPASFPG
jgi:hypothetical protein